MSSSAHHSRSSSPAFSPDDDDDFAGAFSAMNDTVNTARAAASAILSEDELFAGDALLDMSGNTVTHRHLAVNANILQEVMVFAARKRLKAEHISELKALLQDPPEIREGKLFTILFAVSEQIATIVTGQVSFSVSPGLKKIFYVYAFKLLLSSKTTSYKGEAVTRLLAHIMMQVPTIDIPKDIESNPADMALLLSSISTALTNARSAVKKQLISDADEPVDIITFSRTLVRQTGTEVTRPFLCRVALMRNVFRKTGGAKLWDSIDQAVKNIIKKANDMPNNKPEALVAAFKFFYNQDIEKYPLPLGFSPPSAVPAHGAQYEFDILLSATALDTAMALTASTVSPPIEAEESSEADGVNSG